MMRRLHSIFGLIGAFALAALAITGALLATEPISERIGQPALARDSGSVAATAQAAASRYPGLQKLSRTPGGTLVVHRRLGDNETKLRIEPRTAAPLGPSDRALVMQWAAEFHRSFLLGEFGRATAGVCAALMLILGASGLSMLAARMGGWRRLLRPVRGAPLQRLHTEVARIASAGLLLSAATACYLSLASFGFAPDNTSSQIEGETTSISGRRAPIGTLQALKEIDINNLRELTFPRRDAADDVYEIATSSGVGRIDPVTGKMLAFAPHGTGSQVYEVVYMLHAGQGMWPIAIVLGVSALAAPVLIWTGVLIWWRRRRSQPRFRNSGARVADTVILVGSEGGSTWRFAAALHRALSSAGRRVRTIPMNSMQRSYPSAQCLLVLTSTYGDGSAPTNAKLFLRRLKGFKQRIPTAVVGFGDRGFPKFCAFSDDVAAGFTAAGFPLLLQTERIDRQSIASFGTWVDALTSKLEISIKIDRTVLMPPLSRFVLVECADYGDAVGAPTAILRFRPSPSSPAPSSRSLQTKLPKFEAGDLLGVVPPGDPSPRLYSVSSSTSDDVLEVCVRKQAGGVCSTFLHDLRIGDCIDAFIKPNYEFRPARGRSPIVLIGAGAGIGPLVGFVRRNRGKRSMHLYWGGRDPTSDFLYEGELSYYLAERKLTRLRTSFSRISTGGYVQDRISIEANVIRDLAKRDAQFLICGNRHMAQAVASTIDRIMEPIALNVSALKSQGRYVEDVY